MSLLTSETVPTAAGPPLANGTLRDYNRAFALFAFLWALSVIVHNHMRSEWARTPSEFAMSVLAFMILFRPTSLIPFLALILAQILTIFHSLPYVSTHSIIAMFGGLILLSAWLRRMIVERRSAVTKQELYQDASPFLRLLVLILYFWTVFHKLNADFFNPEVSCGSLRYLQIQKFQFPFFPSGIWVQYAVIYLVVVLEAVVPFLLVLRRTRLAGIAVAGIMHIGFAFAEHASFTSLMFALLSLFLPVNFVREWKSWKQKIGTWKHAERVRAAIASPAFRTTFVLAAIVAIYFFTKNHWTGIAPVRGTTGDWTGRMLYFWISIFGLFLLLFLIVARHQPLIVPSGRAILRPVPLILLVFPIAFFENGLNPYLGLNTENSFALYSNLRTELGISNHLVIRNTLQLSSCQTDYVTILAASSNMRGRTRLPGFDSICNLRLRISEAASKAKPGEKLRIVYIRKGSKHVVEDAYTDPELSKRYPYLVRKLMRFKPVPPSGLFLCRH